ncbi:TRAP transporter small permease subunit [Oceanicola sp. 22II-s10i]|uniref:TRAP transporter small permease subunit n=1 Tax=Oceanicola sp. 22II-s10i TaxID=1317116 RepID=UPI000B51F23C|nr:TRAP transporter small permease [Oceanicola sp. 22II-s10i]
MTGAITTSAPDDGFGLVLWRLDGLLVRVERVLTQGAAVAICILMAVGTIQVFMRSRYLFNAPIFGYIDMIELVMPIIAVLGVSYCQREGTHIRMDILMTRLTGRTLQVMELIGALITLVIVILLARFSWVFFHDSWMSGGTSADANLPIWPSKLLVPIALGLLALRLTLQSAGHLRLVLDPSLEPVAVIPEASAEDLAQSEIREVMGNADETTPDTTGHTRTDTSDRT